MLLLLVIVEEGATLQSNSGSTNKQQVVLGHACADSTQIFPETVSIPDHMRWQ